MLLLNDLGLAQNAKSARHKYRPRIARPKRLERPQILRQLKSQLFRVKFRINRQHGRQIIFSQTRGRMLIQAPSKFFDLIAPNRKPGRVRMPTKLFQQDRGKTVRPSNR